MSEGDKREFNNLNKKHHDKYVTRYMTPQSIASREREIQTQLIKDMCEWFLAHGYHIKEKDIRLLGMLGYKPEFHLGFRVFINNISGYKPPEGKSHSFIIRLDGSPLDHYMKEGMIAVPAITPNKRDTNKKNTEKSKGNRLNFFETGSPPQKGTRPNLPGK